MGGRAVLVIAAIVIASALNPGTASSGEGRGAAMAPPAPIQGVVVYGSDLNVTDTLRFLNATIYLTGNLTVKATGSLEFVNTSLRMNLSRNGQFRISVEGKFTAGDLDGDCLTPEDASSIVSNRTGARYTFTAASSSKIYFNNSLVRDCGYDGLNPGLNVYTAAAAFEGMTFQDCYHGLMLRSGGAKVSDCLFQSCNYGVYVHFCNPTLSNLTVLDSLTRGIHVYYSAPAISGCELAGNRVGLYLQNSNPSIVSCTVSGSAECGVSAWYSSPLLADCSLANAVDMQVQMASFPRLLNTSLNRSSVAVALGLYVSVGQHMSALAVNETGAPLGGMRVAVLDSEGNPSSSGTTDGTGWAADLAYREALITKDGTVEMTGHRVVAFSPAGEDILFGENMTGIAPGGQVLVKCLANPEGVEIWPGGESVADARQISDSELIVLGGFSILAGGSLELDNSTLTVYSNSVCEIQCSSGTLSFRGSRLAAAGTSAVLEPARVGISADYFSEFLAEDSEFRWITEIIARSQFTLLRNVSVEHASTAGVRIESCPAAVEGLSVRWAPVGLRLMGDRSAVSNLSVAGARDYAVYASQSSADISRAFLNDSARGLFAYYGNMDVSGMETHGCEYGILGSYAILNAADSAFQGSAGAGLYLAGGSSKLAKVSVGNSSAGIAVADSALWIEEADISGNGVGVRVSGGAPVLLNSSLSNSADLDVARGSSASLVNCTFDTARVSVAQSGWIDVGSWTDVTVAGTDSVPVPGCNVSVRDSMGRVSASGRTDASGTARNLAFRESRMLWNRTEHISAHTVAAFGGANLSLAGENSTALAPGGSAEVTIGNAGNWIVWPSFADVSGSLSMTGANIVAMAGISIGQGASLLLDNSTLWTFGAPKSNLAVDVYGCLGMDAGSIMPLSAKAPLQPARVWLTFRPGSAGDIGSSRIVGINQISVYVSDLAVRNSTIYDIAGTGIYMQSCSPTVEGTVLSQCYDGIWSEGGSPSLSECAATECADNGIYLGGGSPNATGLRSSHNQKGFGLAGGTSASLVSCEAADNHCGFDISEASPSLRRCTALNNSDSGFQMQNSQAFLDNVLSEGNAAGVYTFRSWPLVLNSTLRGNANGFYAVDSGPYIGNCTIAMNGNGLSVLGDARDLELSEFATGGTSADVNFIGGGASEWISLALPERAMVRKAGMNVTGTEIGRDALFTDPYSQFSLALWGDTIVWQDYREGDWEIYAYDLAADSDGDGMPNYLETPQPAGDSALFRVTDDGAWQGEPDVFGDTVVWTDERNGNPDIYAYTFSNSTEWAVCTDPAAQAKPSIDGDRIVWQDYRNGNYDIYMLNITGGEVSRLSDSPYHDMSPKIEGYHVVWYNYHGAPPSSDYSDVFMFDIKYWTAVNVNRDDPIQYSPEVWGDTIVWHDNRDGNWEIYACNVRTLVPERLTYDPEGEQNFMPRIYGDRVVYYFHNRVTDVWSVRMFNMTTRIQTVLERDTDGDAVPVTYGDRVAWVNRSGNLNDIHVLNLSLGGLPEDVSADVNADGAAEFSWAGPLNGTVPMNGTALADALNLALGRMGGGTADIRIAVSANGTGRVALGPVSVIYDVPTYIVSCDITGSGQSGAYCHGSAPAFINSTFANNTSDLALNSEARPRTLNTTFSDAKLVFADARSNLSVQNYLHVRSQNLTGDPLDSTVTVKDNGRLVLDAAAGPDGEIMWCVATDATYNASGRMDNVTEVGAAMGTAVFGNSPRQVDMGVSHWEIFSTDSVGPACSSPHPQPGWTFSGLRPEISAVVTDNLGIDYSSVRLYVQGFMVFYGAVAVQGGYNISYTHPSDFAEGSLISCRIYCMDIHGNVLDFSWDFKVDPDAEYFVRHLLPGWNLVSVPVDSYNLSLESVLWSVSGSYDSVMAYSHGSERPWLTYRPGSYANTLSTIEKERGYWIHATVPCDLQVSGIPTESTAIALRAGWNLVGYPTLNGTVKVSAALWGTGADPAEGWDAETPYVRVLEPTYLMKPGEGYWVHVPADTVWTVDW